MLRSLYLVYVHLFYKCAQSTVLELCFVSLGCSCIVSQIIVCNLLFYVSTLRTFSFSLRTNCCSLLEFFTQCHVQNWYLGHTSLPPLKLQCLKRFYMLYVIRANYKLSQDGIHYNIRNKTNYHSL